jgi:hypothetical protein
MMSGIKEIAHRKPANSTMNILTKILNLFEKIKDLDCKKAIFFENTILKN